VNLVGFPVLFMHTTSYPVQKSEIIRLKPEGVQNHIPPQRYVETLRNESNIKKTNLMEVYTAPDWLGR
jgi:hypothetical protein